MLSMQDKNVIPTISDRLSNAVNIQDRRAAIKALKNLANYYREDIILYSLKNILKCFHKDQLDKEITKYVLQCLLVLFIKNESRETDLSEWLTANSRFQNGKYLSPSVILSQDSLIDQLSYLIADELTQSELNIVELIINSLEFNDFYISLYSLQLLQALVSTRPEKLRETISLIPIAIPNIVANIDSDYDPIRNEAISLLMAVVNNNYNLQRVVAFQDIFPKLFQVIDLESAVSYNNIIIQDALTLVYNLLNSNLINQKLFLESGHLTNLSNYLELFTSASNEPNDMYNQQFLDNVSMILTIISILFISQQNSVDFSRQIESSKVLLNVLKIIFLNYIPNQLKSTALFTLADTIFYSNDLKFQMSTIDVPYFDPSIPNITGADNNGQATLVPVVQLLLNWCLFNNSIHIFDIRLGAFNALKSYFSNNEQLKETFLKQQIQVFEKLTSASGGSQNTPLTGRTSIEGGERFRDNGAFDNENVVGAGAIVDSIGAVGDLAIIDRLLELKISVGNIFSVLLEYDPDIKLNPYKIWFASLILINLVKDNYELKKIVQGLKIKNFNDDDLFDNFFNDDEDESGKIQHDIANKSINETSNFENNEARLGANLDSNVSSPVVVKADSDTETGSKHGSDAKDKEYIKVEPSTNLKEPADSNGADQDVKIFTSSDKEQIEEKPVQSEGTSLKESAANEGSTEISYENEAKFAASEDGSSVNTESLQGTKLSETAFEAEEISKNESGEAESDKGQSENEDVYNKDQNEVQENANESDDDESGPHGLTAIDSMLDLLINSLAFEDKRIAISYLMFLTTYFFENISLIKSFVKNDHTNKTDYIKKLIFFIKQENNSDTILLGMINVLLGVIYDSCPKYLTKKQAKDDDLLNVRLELHTFFLKTVSVDNYKIALRNFKKNELFNKFEEINIFDIRSFEDVEKDNTGLPKIYFHEVYVNTVKENFERILNAFNNDPNSEPNGRLNYSDFLNLSKEYETIRRQLEVEAQAKIGLDAEIAKLTSQLTDSKKERQDALAKLEKVEANNKGLNKNTEQQANKISVLNNIVSKLNTKVANLENDLREVDRKIKNLENEKSKLEQEKKALTASNKKSEDGINKMSRELFHLSKKDQENNTKIANLNKQIQANNKAFETKSATLSKQITRLEQTVKDLESKSSNSLKQIEKLEKEKVELQKGFANYERNLINDLNSMSFRLNQAATEKEKLDATVFQLNSEIKTLKTQLNEATEQHSKNVGEHEARIKLFTEKNVSLSSQISELTKTIEELNNKNSLLAQEHRKSFGDTQQKLNDSVAKEASVRKEIAALEKQLEQMKSGNGVTIDKLNLDLKAQQTKVEEIEKQLHDKEQAIVYLQKENKELLKQLKAKDGNISDLQKSVDATKKNIQIKTTRIDELESEINDLKTEVKTTSDNNSEKILRLKEENNAKVFELESAKAQLSKGIETKSSEVEKLQSEINDLKESIKNTEKTHSEQISQLKLGSSQQDNTIHSFEKQLKEKSNEIESLKKKVALKSDETAKLKADISEHGEVRTSLEKAIDEHNAKTVTLEKDITEHRSKINSLQTLIDSHKGEVNALKQTVSGNEKKSADMKQAHSKEVSDLKSKLNVKQEELKNLQTTLNSSKSRIEKLESSISGLESKVHEFTVDIESKSASIYQLEEDIQTKENKIKDLETDIRAKDENISSLEKELKNKEDTIEKLENSVNDKTIELDEAAKAELAAAKAQAVKDKEARESAMKEKLSKEKEAKQQALKEKAAKEKELKAKVEQVAKLEKSVSDLKQKLYDAQKESKGSKATLLNEKKALEDKVKTLQEEKSKLVEEKSSLSQLLQDKTNDLDAKVQELSDQKTELKSFQEKLKLLESKSNQQKSAEKDVKVKLEKIEAEISTLKKEQQANEEELKKSKLSLEDARKELDTLKDKLSKSTKQHKEALFNRESSLLKDLEDTKSALSGKEKELSKVQQEFQDKINKSQTEFDKLKNENEQLKVDSEATLSDYSKELAELKDSKAKFEKEKTNELASLKESHFKELDVAKSKISSAELTHSGKIKQLDRELYVKTSKIAELEKEIVARNTKLAQLETSSDYKAKELEASLSEKDSRIEALESEVSKKASQVKDLESKLGDKDSKLKGFETSAANNNSRVKELKAGLAEKDTKVKELETDVSDKASKIKDLQNKLSDMVSKSDMDDLMLLMSELDDKTKKYRKKLRELNVEVTDDEDNDDDSDEDSNDGSEEDEDED